MPIFTGTGVALITPFDSRQQIDFQGLKCLLQHTSEGGVDYWVVQGTTGEPATTTAAEKKAILDFVRKNNPRKLPIVYGLGGNHTAEILQQIQTTDLSGVAAVLSVSPYYTKPSQAGIVAHFQAVADASPVPLILYNVPGRTASNLTAATTLRLAEHPNILGIKEASADLVQCMEIAARKPADFLLISGDDLLTLPMMAFGASGVISVLANALPQIFSRIVRAMADGKPEEASQSLFSLLPLNPLMYEEGNPVGVKELLRQMGICGNAVRLPLLAASEGLSERISVAADGIL
jgi:4-hydroxy-tetrahydrodipicolinate synthase